MQLPWWAGLDVEHGLEWQGWPPWLADVVTSVTVCISPSQDAFNKAPVNTWKVGTGAVRKSYTQCPAAQ